MFLRLIRCSHNHIPDLMLFLQVHRVLMLASLFIGVVGVAMVFIGHAHDDNPRGLIELGSGNVSTS